MRAFSSPPQAPGPEPEPEPYRRPLSAAPYCGIDILIGYSCWIGNAGTKILATYYNICTM